SLSSAPVENIRAGTRGYLDPFLPARKSRIWDYQAERYATAVTLHEMVTGERPVWGKDGTEPVHLPEGIEVSLQREHFDASIREGLADSFEQALKRDPDSRFHNADEMLQAWRSVFEHPVRPRESAGPADLDAALAGVTEETLVAELPLAAAAQSALDRSNVL